MTTDMLIETAGTLLAPFAKTSTRPESNRLDVLVSRKDLLASIQALLDAHWGYLSAITGLDHPGTPSLPSVEKQWDHAGIAEVEQDTPHEEGYLESLYHFCSGAAVATVRVHIPYTDSSVPTICGLIPSATLYEREMMEMFGIRVENTPVTDRFLLPDNWPDGVYPLRKEFTGLETPDEA